jgi:hypothetical protein
MLVLSAVLFAVSLVACVTVPNLCVLAVRCWCRPGWRGCSC